MNGLHEAILKTLVYRDLFDFPLTEEEIAGFLIEASANPLAVRRELAQMVAEGKIGAEDGFYFLEGRKGIARKRVRRTEISGRKYEYAFELSQYLRRIPWVRAVFLTGALAAGNAGEDDDLDFMIIAAPGRVWLTRFLAYLFFTVLGVRREPEMENAPDMVCLNMFLSEESLTLPEGERNLFTAHEICLARPLWAKDRLHLRFLAENAWVQEFFPNFELQKPNSEAPRETNLFRQGLDGLLNRVDGLAHRIQLWYMAPRRTREIVERDRIMFHPVDLSRKVLSAFKVRLYAIGHADHEAPKA